jgi:hypothetical protein
MPATTIDASIISLFVAMAIVARFVGTNEEDKGQMHGSNDAGAMMTIRSGVS